MSATTTNARQGGKLSAGNLIGRIPTLGVYGVLILMFILASIFVPGFTKPQNLTNVLQHSVVLGLVAIGQTFVILAASLDLSVGVMISLIGVATSLLISGRVSMILPAVIVALLLGILLGLINGLIITKLRVNSFIATLGMMLVLEGALFSRFDNFAGRVPRQFEFLGYKTVGPVPVGVLLMLAVAALAWLILRFTKFGHHVYGIGGNAEVSRLSGVRTDRIMIGAHILAGLGAAISALFLVSRLRTAAPWIGKGLELDSIAAVVVGGAPLSGGRGSVWGTIGGVLILSILNNVFNLLAVDAFLQDVMRGAIVILVVAFYSARLRK